MFRTYRPFVRASTWTYKRPWREYVVLKGKLSPLSMRHKHVFDYDGETYDSIYRCMYHFIFPNDVRIMQLSIPALIKLELWRTPFTASVEDIRSRLLDVLRIRRDNDERFRSLLLRTKQMLIRQVDLPDTFFGFGSNVYAELLTVVRNEIFVPVRRTGTPCNSNSML